MKNFTKVAGVLVAIGALTAGGVAAFADTTTPTPTTIYGCVGALGLVRIVDATTVCAKSEKAVSWNSTGPAGTPGAAGAAGAQGPAGPQGPVGPAGTSSTGGTPIPNSTVIGTITIDGLQGGDPASPTIDVRSFNLAGANSIAVGSAGSGAGAGKVSFSNLNFVKSVDLASPALLVAAASAKRYDTATLSIYRPGTTTPEETIVLTEVLVASVKQHDEGAATDSPLEDVALSFARIAETVTPTSGPVIQGGWNVTENDQS